MSYELIDPTIYRPLFVAPDDGTEAPALPRHEPPTDDFLEALRSPQYVDHNGIPHAVYRFNRDTGEDEPPLVIVPPVERYNGAASRSGCQLLNGFAAHLTRQVIAVDLPATGNSGRPSLSRCLHTSMDATAEAINRAVDRAGFEGREVDFLGICIGGALAARAAVQRGAHTRSLLTFATPGFETDLLYRLKEQRLRNTPEARMDRRCDEQANRQAAECDNLQADYLEIRELPAIDVRKVRRKLMYGRLGLELLGKGSPMLTLAEDLHPDTRWHDFVGDSDILTSWQNHVHATSRRGPGATQQTVLKEVGHDWPMIRAPHAARLAELALNAAQDERRSVTSQHSRRHASNS